MINLTDYSSKRVLLQGNEACALGAVAAGLKFYAGYPITPSTEIMEFMAGYLPQRGGTFIQMEDEIASIGAVLGASLTGVKAMTATSGPGFSLMQEAIGYGVMAEIPAVIVNVQRLGPSTGAPTSSAQGDMMQARRGSHGDYELIVLSPGTVGECFTLTIKAFNFAEKFRVPVILLMEEVVGHLREVVLMPDTRDIEIINRPVPDRMQGSYYPYTHTSGGVPPMAPLGKGHRFHITGLFHDESGFPLSDNRKETDKLQRRLRDKILGSAAEICLYREWNAESPEDLIITWGSPVRSALVAIEEAAKTGIEGGILALQTIWPFPEELIRKYTKNKKRIIVPEHNFSQLGDEIMKCICPPTELIRVNKVDGGVIGPEDILAYLVLNH